MEFPDAESRDLNRALHRPPLYPGGMRRLQFDPDRFGWREAVAEYVMSRGGADALPLEELHRRLPLADQLPVDGEMNRLSTLVLDATPSLVTAYHAFVRYLAFEILGCDVLFERTPPLRFHFPVPLPERFRARSGRHLAHHSDTLFGQYFEEINFWLPLTSARGTSTIQMASFAESTRQLERVGAAVDHDFCRYRDARRLYFELLDGDEALQEQLLAECGPVEVRYGELLTWDARMVHGTAENREDATRVSIDFRLIPVATYEALMEQFRQDGNTPPEVDGEMPVRGDFYDARNASEVR
jgi:hypothetical protein